MAKKGNTKQAYLNSAGIVVPSVTTILSRFKDSGGLLFWAYKKGMENGRLGNFGAKLYDDTEATDAGTVAHTLVEEYLRDPDTFDVEQVTMNVADALGASPEATQKGVDAFKTFLTWKDMTKLTLKYAEVPLVSEKHQFGGKLDAVGQVMQKMVLGDWKTSNAVYLDYTLQLAAYGLLWEENYPDVPLDGGYHLLRFAKENGDFSHHYFPNLDQEKAAFLTMRKLYDQVKFCEKRVK